MSTHCAICGQSLGDPVYRSASEVSVTSLCEVRAERTEVFFCASCGHLQTPQLHDVERYYAEDYRILVGSEEEDQLYRLADGQMVYRMEHQARTLLDLVQLPPGAAVLDYGCAKAGTLRQLMSLRPDLAPHAFDVSDMYRPFWDRFIPADNQCSHRLPSRWRGRFALVTAFYSFEHIPEVGAAAAAIADALMPDGTFYGIVPNWLENVADVVVVDHIHHFSVGSLQRLLRDAGFSDVRIDTTAHAAALVWRARKVGGHVQLPPYTPSLRRRVEDAADYWTGFANGVRRFEEQVQGKAAIYGSGFYGTFLTTCLQDPLKLACYVDQNPHRQGATLFGRPIVAPERLPDDVTAVYVGLNPAVARAEMAKVASWHHRPLVYFFP